MKNIHILPTDKPSRLWINNLLQGKLELSKEALPYNTAQNIYITSDEESKHGEWCVDIDKFWNTKPIINIAYEKNICPENTKQLKIILTTDQNLINHGVQAIDDEFLEWFVKNPSCEWVEVELFPKLSNKLYGIIIPKEEPKQETLEEVAERLYPIILEDDGWDKNKQYRDEWIEGAKWQQGRMYNEEDIIEFAEWIINQDWDETELNFPNNSKSTKELLQLWKEQKPKTVYYEN